VTHRRGLSPLSRYEGAIRFGGTEMAERRLIAAARASAMELPGLPQNRPCASWFGTAV
jgi:hypothetical protein